MYHSEMQFNYKLIIFYAIRETKAFMYVYCVMIFLMHASTCSEYETVKVKLW